MASAKAAFKLSASGETLTLSAPDGTVVDTVTFGPQVTDISQGRVPDGSATVDFLSAPSAGTANGQAISAPSATATSTSPGTVKITVNTTAGFSYQLQRKDDLSAAIWSNIGITVTGDGNPLTFTDSTAGYLQRFYRVVRTP